MILWDSTNQYIRDDVQIFIHHPGGTTGVLDTAYLCIHNWLMVSNISFYGQHCFGSIYHNLSINEHSNNKKGDSSNKMAGQEGSVVGIYNLLLVFSYPPRIFGAFGYGFPFRIFELATFYNRRKFRSETSDNMDS